MEATPIRPPGTPTAFELEVRRLGLVGSATQQAADKTLRAWVKRNYRALYVPEDLLAEMGLVQEV
jgi:hypothetical protein